MENSSEEPKPGCTFETNRTEPLAVQDPPPSYLPQPADKSQNLEMELKPMEPLGPWAVGRVDWSPMAGLTGTRPVVDSYTITRYSPLEWRKVNEKMFQECKIREGLFYEARCVMDNVGREMDNAQFKNTKRLKEKAQLIYKFKEELESYILGLNNEILELMSTRERLQKALGVLITPESISRTCLEFRSGRLESDLVRDAVEEELISERALCKEIYDLWTRAIEEIETQILANKATKQRLELDWSDKMESYEIDTTNLSLSYDSPSIMFKEGAVRIPNDQSSIQHYENFSTENIKFGAEALKKSQEFRKTVSVQMISEAVSDLVKQSDRVGLALCKRIEETDECRIGLENEFKNVLQRITDTEALMEQLRKALRESDFALKLAQTRLDNRSKRMRVENCRDIQQYGLLDEANLITKSVAAMKAQLAESENVLTQLLVVRGNLERHITTKRNTLKIDQQRVGELRQRFPDLTSLSGF